MEIGYVNVFVSDLQRARAFFESTVGLTCVTADVAFGYAAFSAGPISFAIAVPDETQRDLVGRHTGVGFVVKDLDAEHQRLAAAGVRFAMPPSKQPWGGYLALFEDPDGNIYYLDQPE